MNEQPQRFPVTQAMIYLCASVTILSGFDFEAAVIEYGLWPIGGASRGMSGEFELYQLATYGLMHGSFAHLLINVLLLWMFGRVLEAAWGPARYAGFLCSAVLVSGGAHIVAGSAGLAMGDQAVIGFSGAVAASLVAYAVSYPKAKILLLLPPIPMYAPIAIGGLLAVDAGLALMGMNLIAHAAHWGGALAGLAAGWQWRGASPPMPIMQ